MMIPCSESEVALKRLVLVVALGIALLGFIEWCVVLISLFFLLIFYPVGLMRRYYELTSSGITLRSRYLSGQRRYPITSDTRMQLGSSITINSQRLYWLMPDSRAHKLMIRYLRKIMDAQKDNGD